jgi:DtxR family Mn-dependent transcriptional regulator
VPLTELEVGESARIAYVNCRNDQQLHRIEGLQIRPGVKIKLHQKYPSFVIECEGASIALDREVADNICLWMTPEDPENEENIKKEISSLRRLFPGFKRHRRRYGK